MPRIKIGSYTRRKRGGVATVSVSTHQWIAFSPAIPVNLMNVDDQVGVQGNGNQDAQSWYHSMEINIMVDSELICRTWKDGILRNQSKATPVPLASFRLTDRLRHALVWHGVTRGWSMERHGWEPGQVCHWSRSGSICLAEGCLWCGTAGPRSWGLLILVLGCPPMAKCWSLRPARALIEAWSRTLYPSGILLWFLQGISRHLFVTRNENSA